MDNKKIIWLASYPKSGNTWFRILLTNYLKEEEKPLDINNLYPATIASSRLLFDETLGLSSSDLTFDEIDLLRPQVYKHVAETTEDIFFHKIHDAWQILPNGEAMIPGDVTKGVIYIVRNPLDVAVSFAHHSVISIDSMIKAMNQSDYSFCNKGTKLHIQLRQKLFTWSGHVRSWLDNSDLSVLLMKYEDMLSNPFETFKKALKFVYNDVDENKLIKAIEDSSFQKIKEQELEKGFKEKNQKSASFFRKGKVDSWRDELTEKQIQIICSNHKETMRRFNYLPEEYNEVRK